MLLRSNKTEKHLLKQSLWAEKMFNVSPNLKDGVCSMFPLYLISTWLVSGEVAHKTHLRSFCLFKTTS